MNDAALMHGLCLARTENVGPVTFHQLMARYGSAAAALAAIPELAQRGGLKRKLTIPSQSQIEDELAELKRHNATVLLHGDSAYPPLLHAIADAPPVLIIKGHAHLLTSRPCVAFVGARNASLNGRKLAEKLARDCGEAGFTVVSGLAAGIDASAHHGALATGTVGVIAAGIDSIYPPENAKLYAQMAEQGAIVTEMPIGTPIKANLFPRRNRIVSGLSLGTLVVEAAPQSGSLITARLAGEQGREVMAIPGSPLDPRAQGTNKLIKDGASLVESVHDITDLLRGSLGASAPAAPNYTNQHIEMPDEKSISQFRPAILSALSPVPCAMNDLIRLCNAPPPVVWAIILELELAGKLTRLAGGQVALMADLGVMDMAE